MRTSCHWGGLQATVFQQHCTKYQLHDNGRVNTAHEFKCEDGMALRKSVSSRRKAEKLLSADALELGRTQSSLRNNNDAIKRGTQL
jgi:hypothetical protein